MPATLGSLFKIMSAKCQLTSCDVHDKGKTTVVLRWDNVNAAAIDTHGQPQPVSFGPHRNKSPCPSRLMTQTVTGMRQKRSHKLNNTQRQSAKQTVKEGAQVVTTVTWGRYHGGRRPSSDDSFHSPTVIPPSTLDKPSIMKRYHRRRTTR